MNSLTPISTIVKAYDMFLEDRTGMTGRAVEGSADQLLFHDGPPFLNGRISQRAVTVWEPLFKMMHGENSDLPDAIP